MRISTRSLIFLAVILLILSTVGTALAWEDCPKGKINCTNPCRDYIDTNGNSICDHSESSEQSGTNQNSSQNGAALPGSANTQNGSGVSSEDTEQENIDRGDTVVVPAPETAANQGISGSEKEAKTSPENESAASALTQPVFVVTFLLLVLALLAVKRSLPLYARLGILLIGLLYLGFYLKGCMCPVGVLANLPVRLEDFFQGKNKLWLFLLLLPVVFILPAGRIYCGGVCPFGALQEFTFRAGKRLGLNKGRPGLKKVTWPKYVKYIVLLAVLIITPLIGTVWWCRIDPFVYLFNFSGTAASLILLVILLITSLFISRPWCRLICPYGALLAVAAKDIGLLAGGKVGFIGPNINKLDCRKCGLCENTCPVNAIRDGEIDAAECINCGECTKQCRIGAIC